MTKLKCGFLCIMLFNNPNISAGRNHAKVILLENFPFVISFHTFLQTPFDYEYDKRRCGQEVIEIGR